MSKKFNWPDNWS